MIIFSEPLPECKL